MVSRYNLKDLDLIFLDVETTGLNAFEGDSICEIGALKYKEGVILDEFYTLINPKRKIPLQVSSIHRIYDEDVKDAPYFEEVADSLLNFLDNSIICGYNIGFDLGFLNVELEKIGYPSLQLPSLDILVMVRKTFPSLPRYNLSYVASYFHIKGERFHRALDDALITWQIFEKVKVVLKERGIEKIEDYLSLYGFDNEFFKKFQEPKLAIIKESIVAGFKLKIDYLAYDGQRRTFVVKPKKIISQEKIWFLAKKDSEGIEVRLSLDRILNLEIV